MTQPSKASASGRPISKLEGVLKFRYLGIGFIWTWIYGCYETYAVHPQRTGIGIKADDAWIVSAIVVVITLFVAGLLLGRRKDAPPPWLCPAAAAAATLGTLLSVATPVSNTGVMLLVASGVLTGFGTGALYVLWGQALAQLDEEGAETAIPAASLVMFVGALVLPYLPNLAGIAVTASMPLISGVLLWLTYRDIDTKQFAEPVSASPFPCAFPASFARISMLVFLSYFVIGCSGVIQSGFDEPLIFLGFDWPTLIGALGGISVMVCFVFFAARPRFDSLFRIVAPSVVIAVALLPWADLWATFISSTLISLADMVLTIATVHFVVEAAQRGNVDAALGVGVTQGALQLGVLLGNLAGSAVDSVVQSSPTGLFSAALALLALFALSWLSYPAERITRQFPIKVRSGSAQARSSAVSACARCDNEGAAAESCGTAEGSIDAICNALVEAHGLSGREREILGYLARGRSQPYIRDELVLSKNTVATHVKHIYQKLDVHSRQELLDLFGVR